MLSVAFLRPQKPIGLLAPELCFLGLIFFWGGGVEVGGGGVEVLLYVHRNRRLIRDRSLGRPTRLSHSSWALFFSEGRDSVFIHNALPLSGQPSAHHLHRPPRCLTYLVNYARGLSSHLWHSGVVRCTPARLWRLLHPCSACLLYSERSGPGRPFSGRGQRPSQRASTPFIIDPRAGLGVSERELAVACGPPAAGS